jgi:hypothetical protein
VAQDRHDLFGELRQVPRNMSAYLYPDCPVEASHVSIWVRILSAYRVLSPTVYGYHDS